MGTMFNVILGLWIGHIFFSTSISKERRFYHLSISMQISRYSYKIEQKISEQYYPFISQTKLS